jgi:hypothetical protein
MSDQASQAYQPAKFMANNPSSFRGASSAKNRLGVLPRELAGLTTQPSPSNKAAVQKAVHFLKQECQLKNLKRGESMLASALGPVSDADFTRAMIDALNYFAIEFCLPNASGYSFRPAVSGWMAGKGNPKPLSKISNCELTKLYYCC